MKVLCVSCDRLAEMGGYRLDAGVLVISCSRCGAEMRAVDAPAQSLQVSAEVPAAPALKVVPLRRVSEADPVQVAAKAATAPDPFAAPEGRCPKCIAERRPDALSCPQCGLTYVNFAPDEVKPPPPLDALWRELLAHWDDTASHDRMLAAAVSQQALPQIGRLYQIRFAVNQDDPQARRGRDEVVRLAMASASATALPPESWLARRATKVVLLVGGILTFIMLAQMLIRQIQALGAN